MMNQILNTNLNNDVDGISSNTHVKHMGNGKFFRVQFILSVLAIIVFASCFIYYKLTLNKRENFSHSLINNYHISRLYASQNDTHVNTSVDKNATNNMVLGIIEIPSIHVFYPIFSELTDDLLKVSPCRFYGEMPTQNSNLCIAGHNYDNDKFFSHIASLQVNDEIILYDNFGNNFHYSVFENYEVKENDLSPIYHKISDSYELTLITCNNFNNNRIIIKAQKKVS